METVSISGINISKIICGTNAFYGRSHFSVARDTEYETRFNDAYLKTVLRKCIELGVNTVETSANERIQKIVEELRNEQSNPFYLMGNTRIDKTSGMKSHQEKFNFLIENKADICIIHSQFVDRPRKTEEIRGLDRLLQTIRDAGLITGISTHRVSTVECCERNNYDIDLYLFPLNMSGFVYPGYDGNESVQERIEIIQNTKKHFVIMKTLAAGRIPPDEGLQFVLENIKSNDIITLGLGSLEETEESLGIVEKYLEQK